MLGNSIQTFSPDREGFLVAQVDNQTSQVLVQNERLLPIVILRRTRLGTIESGTQVELTTTHQTESIYSIQNPRYLDTEGLSNSQGTEVSGALEGLAEYQSIQPTEEDPKVPRQPIKTLKPNIVGLYGTGPYGVTIYRTLEVYKRYVQLLEKYLKLFIDNRKTADIPEEDQITIPLVNDQNTSGAKLAYKVYPLGPKDYEVLDRIYDKLYD